MSFQADPSSVGVSAIRPYTLPMTSPIRSRRDVFNSLQPLDAAVVSRNLVYFL